LQQLHIDNEKNSNNCVIYSNVDADNNHAIVGYPKLVAFGYSKIMEEKASYTLCGSPEFLAPEMVLGKAHSKVLKTHYFDTS